MTLYWLNQMLLELKWVPDVSM